MDISLLKSLTGVYGPSGHEELVAKLIMDQLEGHVDEITKDRMGNVVARIKGDGPKVMFAAHMDQIGLMVKDIDDKGFVKVTNIGGINPYVTLGERVLFQDGTIGMAFTNAKDKGKLKLNDIFIDIGAKDKEEAEAITSIGDVCVYAPQFEEGKHILTTGAMDDRIGCFVLIEAIKKMKSVKNDCYFAFTVQEEVGIRGGKMTSYAISPDVGIAVDITSSGDTPGAEKFNIGLHKGAAIKVRDNSLLSHPKVNEYLVQTCKAHDIPYQMEVLEFGGTDAGAISLTKEGIPASCISIPTRYAHSAHETCSKDDIEAAIKLVVEVVQVPLEV